MPVSTTTTLNDGIYSAWIEPVFLGMAMDWVVMQQFLRKFSLVGKGSSSLQIPRLDSNMGAVGDNASGVDTEFDATEGSDLASTTATTSKVTGSVSEYGIRRDITDDVTEDTVSGLDIINKLLADAARILMTAFEADVCALIASLSNSVGSTGVNPTVAVALSAQSGIRTRGYPAQDGIVNVWDEQTWADIEAALIAAGDTNVATYGGIADRLLGVDGTANNGMGNGHVGFFRQYPVFATGLTPTMNAGADVASASFVPSSPANDEWATFASIDKRPFRVEPQRDGSARLTELNFTMRKGAVEATDGSGTLIVGDF